MSGCYGMVGYCTIAVGGWFVVGFGVGCVFCVRRTILSLAEDKTTDPTGQDKTRQIDDIDSI
jgi:hypothetical protein